jgi:hypothetical protein
MEFADRVLTNAAGFWVTGDLAQRRQIQHAIFPEGLPSTDASFEPLQRASVQSVTADFGWRKWFGVPKHSNLESDRSIP